MTKDEALKMALDALWRIAGDDLQRWEKVADPGSIAWHVLRAIAACREALAQKDEQEPVGVAVPSEALSLSGDAKLAHDQCRAVVRLANSFAEIYAARAAIVAHDAKLADLIGDASASAMQWLGDELNAMDAASEDDGWLDPIFEAAQERWPQPPKRKPLSEKEIGDIFVQYIYDTTGTILSRDWEPASEDIAIARAIEQAHGIGDEA